MATPVTDPALLAQLNAPEPSASQQVTDPAVLAQLNSEQGDTQVPQQETSLADIGSNFLKAAMRPIMGAVTGIPEMAANAGVGLRNLSEQAVNRMSPNFAHAIYSANRHLAGDNQLLQALLPQGYDPSGYGSFSSEYRPALAQTYGEPQGLAQKAPEFVSTVLAGGAVPAPQAAAQAPAGFVRAVTTPRDLALDAGQARGMVVPPATTNPTGANKILESIGGKAATAQDASAINQKIIDDAARQVARLGEGESITPAALRQASEKALGAYNAVRASGEMAVDESYANAVDDAVSKFRRAGESAPSLGNPQLVKTADELKSKALDGDTAVDYIILLREKANEAYRAGSDKVGAAYKSMAKATEELIDRSLTAQGKDGAATLAAFRDGRKALAQIADVADALHAGSGHVTGSVLKNAFESAPERMSGPLRTVGAFASNFPQATKLVTDSGAVRNTDVALGGLAAVMQHATWPLLYPFARLGVRQGLLSSPSMAVPGSMQVAPGLLTGLGAGEEQLLGK